MSMSVFDDFRFSYERIFRRYERINIVNQKTEVLEECQEKS